MKDDICVNKSAEIEIDTDVPSNMSRYLKHLYLQTEYLEKEDEIEGSNFGSLFAQMI